jgi:hypothetical protein
MALAPPVLCHTVPMAPEHRHVAATVRDGAGQCPLCGGERTLSECIATSQFDPKQKSHRFLVGARLVVCRKTISTRMMVVSAIYCSAGAINVSPETGPWFLPMWPSQCHSARND